MYIGYWNLNNYNNYYYYYCVFFKDLFIHFALQYSVLLMIMCLYMKQISSMFNRKVKFKTTQLSHLYHVTYEMYFLSNSSYDYQNM